MRQFDNQQGLLYTASGVASIELFAQAIDAYLSSKAEVIVKLRRLLDSDPEMPMAH
jgi:hypothetical protein